MSGFMYGMMIQWKMDIRSRSILVTCYIVPLIFFLLMGGIFVSVMPEMKKTLIQSMAVMSVSMGAFIGMPPSILETYGGDVKKLYKANNVPLYVSLITMVVSTFVHLVIMCGLIVLLAPGLFGAELPKNLPIFFAGLGIFLITSLAVGSVLGLLVKNQANLTMIAQIVFLPSIMLSGIMFPQNMLPEALQKVGEAFPAFWGYRLMSDGGMVPENIFYLAILFCVSGVFCLLLLKKKKSD